MNGEKRKILIAEDDKFITKAYKAGLEKEGFEVIFASDGETALVEIKTNKPSLVLLDLMMPKKNGFDVLVDMKLDESVKDTPVIVLSNLGQSSDIEKAKSMGAVDYLVKSQNTLSEVVTKVKQQVS